MNKLLIPLLCLMLLITSCESSSKRIGELPVNNISLDANVCQNSGNTACNENIPSYIQYINPRTDVPEQYEINLKEMENYFMRTNKSIEKNSGLWYWDTPDLDAQRGYIVCKETGVTPEIASIFTTSCDPKYADMAGGCSGYERSAVICGSWYIITQFHESFGPTVYGPFNIN